MGTKPWSRCCSTQARPTFTWKDGNGWTPLLLAAAIGREAVVKLLLDTDRVDVDSKSSSQTPLSLAAMRRHEVVVRLLRTLTTIAS